MGAVSAFVYIFVMFCFIPFPYYKYLVTETSGAGNRDVEETVTPNFLENGRTLHLFPHNKVQHSGTLLMLARRISSCFVEFTKYGHPWHCRRYFRYSMET